MPPSYLLGQLSLIAAIISYLSLLLRWPKSNSTSTKLILNFISIISAWLVLSYGFATDNFGLMIVALNSHNKAPIIYKLVASWGNHEGSLLLISLIISFYINAQYFLSRTPISYREAATRLGCWLGLMLLVYSFVLANPFVLSPNWVARGMGLNPSLEDVGLIIHPPILYLGFFGSLVSFIYTQTLARKGLIENWAGFLIPWVRHSLMWLTLGIALGSWWAYRELGWGGFWFWDPVENIALMPWLASLMMLHFLLLAKRYPDNKLSFLCFAASALNMWLVWGGCLAVRSGVLNSVHSFAESGPTAWFMVATLLLLITASCSNLSHYKRKDTGHYKRATSHAKIIIAGQIALALVLLVVFIGTIAPLMAQLTLTGSIVVESGFYNRTLGFIIIPVLLLMVVKQEGTQYQIAIIASLVILTSILSFYYSVPPIAAIVIVLCALLAVWSLYELIKKHNIASPLGHLGFSILIIGAVLVSLCSKDYNLLLEKGETIELHGHKLQLHQLRYFPKHHYLVRQAEISWQKENQELKRLTPELRFYPQREQFTNKTSIYHGYMYDVYITIGEVTNNNPSILAVSLHWRPFIGLVWLGSVIIVFALAYQLLLERRK